MLAICPNNNEIHIYGNTTNPDSSAWQRLHVLTEHDLLVSAIDWSPVTNKIVSCSHDRNAFVWTFDAPTNTWKPSLVILRIDRAALDVKWSPDGLKFATASGAKCVPICHYEAKNDWWVSKMIKKHKSTVTCCAWHPNSQLLATGSTDFKARIFSAYVSDVDPQQETGAFGAPVPFGETYAEFSTTGWVHCIAWSPNGNLVFATHDSSMHFVHFEGGNPVVQVVRYSFRPLSAVTFVSERAVVAGGHDMNPLVFSADASGQWSFLQLLDQKREAAKSNAPASGVQAARALFQNKATRGQESKQEGDELWTKHENAITCIQRLGASTDPTCSKFSTSALDGRLVVWDLPTLEIDMRALGL